MISERVPRCRLSLYVTVAESFHIHQQLDKSILRESKGLAMAAVQAAGDAMDPSSGAKNTLKLENVSHTAVRHLCGHDLTDITLD